VWRGFEGNKGDWGGVWKAPEENRRKEVLAVVKSSKLLIIIGMIKAGKLS
jgi:hypothetical protein